MRAYGCRGAPYSPCRRFTLTMKRSVFHSLDGERSWERFEGRGYYTLHLPCSFHGLLVPGKIGYFLQLIDEFSNCGIWWEWYWKHMWQANSVKKKSTNSCWAVDLEFPPSVRLELKTIPGDYTVKLWRLDLNGKNVFHDQFCRHSIPVLVKCRKAIVPK